MAKPKEIPALLPGLLSCIRMIWNLSKFYNTEERLTGLLRKISNEVGLPCTIAGLIRAKGCCTVVARFLRVAVRSCELQFVCAVVPHDFCVGAIRAAFQMPWEALTVQGIPPRWRGMLVQGSVSPRRCMSTQRRRTWRRRRGLPFIPRV